MTRLLQLLTYRRPAGSLSERDCIDRFIKVHPHVMMQGNIVITLPKADGAASTTLFSCHTDTMHVEAGRQTLIHDTVNEQVFVDKPKVMPLPP